MSDVITTTAAAPGRIARNTSVATRLSFVVVLVALVSVVITSVVGLQRGGELADDVLQARLSAIGAARADEVERYMASLQRAVIGQAISPSTAAAIDQFGEAYRELQVEDPSVDDTVAVDEYYRDVVAPELSEVRGRPVSAAGLVPRAPAAVHLQANYVVPSGDDGALLADAGDGSSWSELHRSLHSAFEEFAIQTAVDDFYLIEPDGNTVVYSTAKDIDFATSLISGPQSGSALAALINSFEPQPERGVAIIEDFTSYTAAGDEPSAFVASPVIVDETLEGFVAIRIGPDQLTSITTDDGSWTELGVTGETYLVALDDLMRSTARGFIEDQDTYVDEVRAAGTATEGQIRSMETFDTTILFQPVSDEDVEGGLTGDSDVVETTNYLGQDVLSSRRPLDVEGLDWALFAEIERAEIEQPIVDFVRNLLIAIAVFIVMVTFLAVWWSDRLLAALRLISARLRAVQSGEGADAGSGATAIPDRSPKEFVDLAADIDTMLETLRARNADAEERALERRDLLRQILPPKVAQRAEAGERDVLDQVSQASVAVIVIRGLGFLMRANSRDAARDLLDRFVEETDALARQRGLERIRLTGDAYIAGCGTVRPQLDHATRALAFVLDVRELVGDLAGDDELISMSAGLDSGPVTVGLTGGHGLVYDSWGPTVRNAADLARRARPGEVLVSAAIRQQLPSGYLIEEYAGPVELAGAMLVAGRTSEGGVVQ